MDCMADIATTVDQSAVCNVSQLVHMEDAEIVPIHDWPSFLLPHFKKIAGIRNITTSGYPPPLQGLCMSESILTHQRSHCLFCGIRGSLRMANFLRMFS